MTVDLVFAIPGDIDTPTGGYGYDRQVLAHLPAQGIGVTHLPLPGSFPLASVPDLSITGYLLNQTAEDAVVMVDGLAFGAMTELVLKDIHRTFVALVHHPLALETGLTDRLRRALAASERSALSRATHVIVTSPITARTLVADYGVPGDRITVALPGTDRASRAKGSGSGRKLLCVGTVSPRKAYDVLARALAGLKDRDWHVDIAGETDRVPGEYDRVASLVRELGLEDRVSFIGVLDRTRLDAAYDEADLFVMPSLYEGYGMVLAEAMARGLPIVCTTGGAAAETVPDGAGLKVPPGDAEALRQALARALDDTACRAALAEGSWKAGQALPTWEDTARTIAGAVRQAAASAPMSAAR